MDIDAGLLSLAIGRFTRKWRIRQKKVESVNARLTTQCGCRLPRPVFTQSLLELSRTTSRRPVAGVALLKVRVPLSQCAAERVRLRLTSQPTFHSMDTQARRNCVKR